ncbi:MAG: hypothetical protein R3F38_14640 [Gammaproteobacteria bacterium]
MIETTDLDVRIFDQYTDVTTCCRSCATSSGGRCGGRLLELNGANLTLTGLQLDGKVRWMNSTTSCTTNGW